MNDNTKKDFSELTLEEMEAVLPVYHGEVLGRAGIELSNSEYQRLNNTKWKWKNTGQRIYDLSMRDVINFLEDDAIEPIEETKESLAEMERRLGITK